MIFSCQRNLPSELTAMHCLMMHDCFIRPGPPNFFMSLQKWHSPHSVRRHASHFRQRVRLLLAPDVPRLADSLTAEAGDAATFGLGRLGGLGWERGRRRGTALKWDYLSNEHQKLVDRDYMIIEKDYKIIKEEPLLYTCRLDNYYKISISAFMC